MGRMRLCPVLKLLLAILMLSPAQAAPQSKIPADAAQVVLARFKDKVVPLRHLADADSMKYDAAGKLQGDSDAGDWTLHGYFEITSAEVKNSTLTIKGNRVGLSFRDWERLKQPQYVRMPDELKIQIEARKDVAFSLEDELTKAFLPATEDFPENMPEHWKRVVCKMKQIEEQCPAKNFDPEVSQVGKDGVTEPRLVRQAQPEYSKTARQARLEGQVELLIIVDVNGRVLILEVRKPIGLGLEERAIEAVKKWEFEPARRDGGVTAAYVSILVNYSLRKD